MDRFKRQAEQLVASTVTLIDECAGDAEILEALKASPAGRARGEPGKRTHVLIWYDQQDAGEATAQPHLRTPPMRSKGEHLKKFIRMAMNRTEMTDDLDESDVYVVNDAGRSGNKTVILNSFTNAAGHVPSDLEITSENIAT